MREFLKMLRDCFQGLCFLVALSFLMVITFPLLVFACLRDIGRAFARIQELCDGGNSSGK